MFINRQEWVRIDFKIVIITRRNIFVANAVAVVRKRSVTVVASVVVDVNAVVVLQKRSVICCVVVAAAVVAVLAVVVLWKRSVIVVIVTQAAESVERERESLVVENVRSFRQVIELYRHIRLSPINI